MSIEEANKIIAEYMHPDAKVTRLLYTESLDSLIPVWEKMDNKMIHCNYSFEGDVLGLVFQMRPDVLGGCTIGLTNTIEEVHEEAIATAKAILVLKA